MVAFRKNDTWDLVLFTNGCKSIGCKWVLKKNIVLDRKVEKQKTILVPKGYSKVKGIKFGEITLVSKLTSIRFLLYVASTFGLEREKMDVKTIFLHGNLKDEISMTYP